MQRICFKCGKLLESSMKEEVFNVSNPPDDAIYFNSRGNYGSAVFDPFDEDIRLEGYICDACLKAFAARLFVITGASVKVYSA